MDLILCGPPAALSHQIILVWFALLYSGWVENQERCKRFIGLLGDVLLRFFKQKQRLWHCQADTFFGCVMFTFGLQDSEGVAPFTVVFLLHFIQGWARIPLHQNLSYLMCQDMGLHASNLMVRDSSGHQTRKQMQTRAGLRLNINC